MKTITLENELSFTDAVQQLLDGKCIGIKPKGSINFIVKYKSNCISRSSPHYLLCWNRSVKEGKGDQMIRIDQYMDTWFLVVINTNDLPENIKESFIFQNIIGLSINDN